MLRALFGRHKSASTWARSILHEAAEALDLQILTIHVLEQWADHPTLGDKVRAEQPDILILTNATQSDVDTLPEYRAVNLFRDPRDIIISGYFSHRNSHPKAVMGIEWPALLEHRANLQQLDKEAGIHAEIEFSGLFLHPMREWKHDNPAVLDVPMEDAVADPVGYWEKIFGWYGLFGAEGEFADRLRLAAVKWNLAPRRAAPPGLAQLRKVLPRLPLNQLPRSYARNVTDRFTFSYMAKSDRKPGEEDENSHYRKGVAGDWKNHFTAEHLKAFRKRYGDLVEKLGYPW